MKKIISIGLVLVAAALLVSCGGGGGGSSSGGSSVISGGNELMGGVFGWDVKGEKLLVGAEVSLRGTNMSTKTNQKGDYDIPWIPPGEYIPTAKAEGYEPTESAISYRFTENTKYYWTPTLYPACNTLEGFIKVAISQTESEPVVGAVVSIVGTQLNAVSNEKGWFGLGDIPNGVFQIKIESSYGILTYTLNFTGKTHMKLSPAYCTLSGTVTEIDPFDASKKLPLPGAKVSILGTDLSAISDQEGNYNFLGIPIVKFEVKAEKTGYQPTSCFIEFFGIYYGQWNPQLSPLNSLQGTVKEKSLGGEEKPLPGATVSVLGTGLSVVTDANGSYQILEIPAGQYTVVAEKTGYRSETTALTWGELDHCKWDPILNP